MFKNYMLNKEDELERLYHSGFEQCIREIHKMDTIKKSEIAARIEQILLYLNEEANRYGTDGKMARVYDESLEDYRFVRVGAMSSKEFENILNKIKRYETLLYWLYEIDIAYDQSMLEDKIREAREEIGKMGEDETSEMARQERRMAKLEAERSSLNSNSEEIIDMAKMLTMKYCN